MSTEERKGSGSEYCSLYKSIDKLVAIPARPLRDELTAFDNSGAGMELFSMDGMSDMCGNQAEFTAIVKAVGLDTEDVLRNSSYPSKCGSYLA